MKTSRIKLMTGGIIAGFHHPIKLASRIAMADCLSHGRIETGFVRGYLPYEFEAFDVNMDESRSRYSHGVKAISKLLVERDVNYTCPHFTIRDATILPRPVQIEKFPIWCAATISKESFEFAARNKFDLSIVLSFSSLTDVAEKVKWYRDIYKEGRVSCFAPLFLDDDHNKAVTKARKYYSRYQAVWSSAVSSWRHRRSNDYDPAYEKLADVIRFSDFEYLSSIGTVLAGSPETIRSKVEDIMSIIKPQVLLWNIDVGGMPFPDSAKTLKLFADHFIGRLEPKTSKVVAV